MVRQRVNMDLVGPHEFKILRMVLIIFPFNFGTVQSAINTGTTVKPGFLRMEGGPFEGKTPDLSLRISFLLLFNFH